jgi:hypothetical protein
MRSALIATVGFVLAQMLPSLAEQSTPDAISETETVVVSPEPSPLETDSVTITDSISPSPTPSISYGGGESLTAKAKVVSAAGLFFRTPASIQVDPRATSVRFDAVAIGGAPTLLACINSRNTLTVQPTPNLLVAGQGTGNLVLSGNISDVLTSLTSGSALTLRSAGHISGSEFTINVSALSKPSVDEKLCSSPQIIRSVSVTALGIDLNLVKTPVNLGKK